MRGVGSPPFSEPRAARQSANGPCGASGRPGQARHGTSTVSFASGKVSGSTGCNQFQGTVGEGESATSLVIGPLITTRKACPEPLIAQEHAFLEKLEQAEVFQFLFGDLVLSGANGALVFSPRVD